MATEVISTIRSSGGDYTSLSAWEAGEQGDLTGVRDEISTAELYDDWPSGLNDSVTIDGWTTDSTRYVRVTVASGHRHNGVPKSGFFLEQSTAGTSLLLVWEQYTRVEWVDGEQLSTSSGKYCFREYSANNVRWDRCIGRNRSSNQPAFLMLTPSEARQCLAYSSFMGFYGGSANCITRNCVAANCTTGYGGSGGAGESYNCIAYSNTTQWASGWAYSGLGSHNATSSGSDDAPGANSVVGIASGDFVNAAGNGGAAYLPEGSPGL